MNKNLFIYGQSKLAQTVRSYFSKSVEFTCHDLTEYPTEKIDGLVLSFIDKMSYKDISDIAKTTRDTKNKTLFISSFSSRQMVIGTTHLSNETACIDSTLYYLLYQKYQFSTEEELNKIKIPAFDKVIKDAFFNKVYLDVLNKIVREARIILSNDIAYLRYVNKADVISVKSGKTKEEFIYPLLEEEHKLYVESQKSDFKVLFSNFLNTKSNSKHKNYHRDTYDGYKSVGIVGGGTAGYLTAIALKRKYPGIEVNLIESRKIPVIGVGEATTPILPTFLFKDLKFDKADFYKKVRPTWKLGIKFFWGMPKDYHFNYPFGSTNILASYLNGNINESSLASILMSKNASFVFEEEVDEEAKYFSLSDKLTYAYHLDNKLFVDYLQQEARKVGVVHKDAEIVHVEKFSDKEGIDYLKTKDGDILKYEFYVDCTGFRSLLIGKTMKSPYIPYTDSLFTDSAVVANVPNGKFVKPYTLAESMNSGWCWNTPLRDSDHRGYVYSSSFCSEEDAVKEMRAKNPTMEEHRLIRYRTGRHSHFVKSNVAAIGNSFGFVEPLESTGIHMIIKEVQTLRDNFTHLSMDKSDTFRDMINQDVIAQWDYLKWFLAIHYKFNKKFDTPFWKHAREKTDISGLEGLIDIYKNIGMLKTLSYQVQEKLEKEVHDHLFGLSGIDNMLLGQNVLPKNIDNLKAVNKALWKHNVAVWNELAESSVALKDDIEILNNNPALM